ncbi:MULTISPECIES: TatD family hydrolase [unclassified Salinivibrio]|uniref:TatD family hydrolase n=1 Tax=unclassified Salinivibrio TaxID=2636825 RepID=UPI0006146B09|nr:MULTISPECIES: TatD family hydrolase [unclassified Salinivibrio]KKA44864.1 DNase TatD [Salinivibrio sp. KP-1]MPS33597.1 YchF/TatD family DNA exonuclease [Salinivibrio sp. VYel7]MPX92047.1 YchF/TatD family DNA exonuclease [Salinivibrio sp. VYel1]MPX94980.1 YchF/TatD family DNA exonuclease [Salinivibrio sp. VYel9]MPX96631.1 YchF/TatD family DNA exonuclease [Salinivibrio sp. VYel6]
MIDIGVNLTSTRFDQDRETVVADAKQAGVTGMILTGTSIDESQAAAALASSYPGFAYATAGVHPHDAKSVEATDLSAIQQLAQRPEVVAIGECGLDFNRDFSPRPQQEAVFEAQLALAAELSMPVFMHCRDAHDRWFAILRPWLDKLPAAVLHCFTGDDRALRDCLDVGLYIGVTGWLCDERRGQQLQQQVSWLPDDRLMIETDAPYLQPRDIRPRPKRSRNEPKYLPHIAQTVARLRQQPVEHIIDCTIKNTQRCFSIQ